VRGSRRIKRRSALAAKEEAAPALSRERRHGLR